MPSERFYKLPEEKRNRIKDAAMHEFCEVAMENVSINKIVKEAGISRGSFYTYFEDKQDVLRYLLQDAKNKQDEFIKKCMIEQKGDYIKSLYLLLDYSIEYFEENNFFDFSRNIAIRNGFNPILGMEEHKDCFKKNEKSEEELADWIYEHIDKTKYNIASKEIIRALMIQVHIAIMIAVSRILLTPQHKEAAMRQFDAMLTVLKEGVYKK
ncbi:MAG: TetR/AcrR family transcriptional regulator [Eubacteriales bacterium]|nr:TetR/AcrR family transcriptional regulator [Eubacteriales bacterium]